MFLSGLWHGAGLNFIVWGLWHGLLLAGHRLWSNWRQRRSSDIPEADEAGRDWQARLDWQTRPGFPSAPLPSRLASWLLTFILVNLGWAFFCMDLPTALFFYRRLFIG
jgi:alginate O-acetyltransferase complex protein AlgI